MGEWSDIRVIVTVRTPNEEPLNNVPVSYRSSTSVWTGTTAASGTVTIPGQAVTGDTELFVVISPGPPPVGGEATWQNALSRYRQLIDSYAFDRFYIIPLVQGQTEYPLTIVARPAIKVRGVVADALGAHPTGSVLHSGAVMPAELAADGTFTIGGVPKNAPFECFLLLNEGTVVPLKVPASAVDVDLGSIVPPARPALQGSVRLNVTTRVGDELRREALNSGVTLMAADGSRMFTYLKSQAGEIKVKLGSDEVPKVAPGTYYIAPGLFSANAVQLKLLAAIRNHVDLPVATLPPLVATGGQETTATIDIVQLRTAIGALAAQ